MSVLMKIGNKEVVDGLYNIESIHYDSSRLSTKIKKNYDISLPYIPQRETEVGTHFFADVNSKEVFLYNKEGETYTFVISFKALFLLDQVDDLKLKYTYTNHEYTFPDSSIDYIQYNNNTDRQNFQDIIIDSINRDPQDIISFRPLSNNNKELTASQIIEMGKFIKNKCDQINSSAWNKKNEIRNANISQLDSIDITTGWN